MNKAEKINYEDGVEVWKLQMFTLPQTLHDTSVEIIDKERTLSELEEKMEEAKAFITLAVAKDESLKNQTVRDAQVVIKLATDESYVLAKNQVKDLQREIDILKSRQKKYEMDFKTLKDNVYYSFRVKELEEQKK